MSEVNFSLLTGPLMFAALGLAAYVVGGWFIRRSDRPSS
jgi:hypothetical protein